MLISDLRFLVVEDHGFQRRMLLGMLTGLGARHLLEAADGRSAMNILEDTLQPVDIIISDLKMDGMDGMEFIRHLGKDSRAPSLIILSSMERQLLASVKVMAAAYGVKLLDVLEKPATPEKLEPAIYQHRQATMNAQKRKPAAPAFPLEDILQGLHRDEFEPFFQPKIELSTGRLKGAEALARWRHPDHGIVPPYAFIQPLEDAGRVDELMWAMLRKAADVCKTWQASGVAGTVSVNLSPTSLHDVKLAEQITELVRNRGLDPSLMVLEVTESATAIDVGKTLEILTRLRMKGFGLSIDDYGTGYSSMQQLVRIPFSELKIDQSFVSGAGKQKPSRIVLESSLGMARKLNITSVAEGVETQEDWNLLSQLGCDLAQGYFIARPMQAEAYRSWAMGWAQDG
jgi:EAL domain-containing protein (putative c-di-GMP-specific phosphodiesterase class I)/AmiR/NasT family two-component response regulator